MGAEWGVIITDHSSAGRAEDCRVAWLSLGRWFDSGWSEFFIPHKSQYKRLIRSFPLLSLQFDAGHLVEGRQRELFLDRLAVLQLRGALQQIAEVLGAGLQLLLLVPHHGGHDVVPGGLALPDLLDEVDRGRGQKARGVVEELGLQEGQFKDVLGEVLILGLEADDLAERLEELVGGVDDQLEVELFDDVRFLLEDLSHGVLSSTARNELLDLGHLVGLLELGRNVQRSHSDQLQLPERHILDGEVLVDQRSNSEDSFGEHLVLVVEFTQPIQQLRP